MMIVCERGFGKPSAPFSCLRFLICNMEMMAVPASSGALVRVKCIITHKEPGLVPALSQPNERESLLSQLVSL